MKNKKLIISLSAIGGIGILATATTLGVLYSKKIKSNEPITPPNTNIKTDHEIMKNDSMKEKPPVTTEIPKKNLSELIKQTDLGLIITNSNNVSKEEILNALKKVNPNLLEEELKFELKLVSNKDAIISPLESNKWVGELKLSFLTKERSVYKNEIIESIKNIWNKYFFNKLTTTMNHKDVLESIKTKLNIDFFKLSIKKENEEEFFKETKKKIKQKNSNSTTSEISMPTVPKSQMPHTTSSDDNKHFLLKIEEQEIKLEIGNVKKGKRATKYVDSSGNLKTTLDLDLSNYRDVKEILEIGYHDTFKDGFKIIKFPKDIKTVSRKLPKQITNLEEAFEGNINSYIDGISNWDTSNIDNMRGLFKNAIAFNQDISNWNTKKVTDMSEMFDSAKAFNKKPNGKNWDTSLVTTMRSMFRGASKFNQDISDWKTNNVNDMAFMFQNATSFNQKIGNWDTKKVTDMRWMFNNASSFDSDLNNWKTNSVTNMEAMFFGASVFNRNLKSWDVSKVTDMHRMFSNASKFNQDLSEWKPKKVKNMTKMFYKASSYNMDLKKWETSLDSLKFASDFCEESGLKNKNDYLLSKIKEKLNKAGTTSKK